MPVKLIGTIIMLILVTIFAGVNLDNKCDITFIFYTFKDIPVFMTVIISFAIGAVLMFPFTLGCKKAKKNPKIEKSSEGAKDESKKAPATESKTLFDFKIKREKSETKKADKKGKKDDDATPAADSNAESGTPV